MGSYTSFVVRVWFDEQTRMHGTIQHVASRDRLGFVDPQAMIAFILGHVGPSSITAADPVPSPPDSPEEPDDGH